MEFFFAGLLVYYLRKGFKESLECFLGGCWFTNLAKDSRKVWSLLGGGLLVYYLSKGFKESLESFLGGCWFTTLAKDSRKAWSIFGGFAGLLP